uniref:(California timema) hypothetical protein n=1 Tax=Timema californicum TaxID=61474 RepID=A0A7R9IYK1_TIMCA|nr:unnamed protein product [Timema californicum]
MANALVVLSSTAEDGGDRGSQVSESRLCAHVYKSVEHFSVHPLPDEESSEDYSAAEIQSVGNQKVEKCAKSSNHCYALWQEDFSINGTGITIMGQGIYGALGCGRTADPLCHYDTPGCYSILASNAGAIVPPPPPSIDQLFPSPPPNYEPDDRETQTRRGVGKLGQRNRLLEDYIAHPCTRQWNRLNVDCIGDTILHTPALDSGIDCLKTILYTPALDSGIDCLKTILHTPALDSVID